MVLPEVTPAQRAENDRRMAYEDSVRKAYMVSFPDHSFAEAFVAENGLPAEAVRLVEGACGNGKTITEFLLQAEDKERAVQLLASLTRKDLSDVTPEVLWDSYNAKESILRPRIESEFLTSYKGWFLENVPADLQSAFKGNAQAIKDWVEANIYLDEDPLFWDIPMSPVGVWKSRWANARSRDLLTQALARTFGVEMRRDRFTSALRFSGDKADVPTGHVELTYEPVEGVERAEYGRHYSVSRIVDGEMEMVFLGFGRESRRFGLTNDLPEGDYLLASGNRLSDGSTPVTVTLFHVTPGESLQVPVLIETVLEAVEVQGHFDASALPVSEGNYAAAILDVGMEPTNHVLHDIAEEKAELEAWGRPILLIATSEAQMERLHHEIEDGRFGTLPSTVQFLTNTDGSLWGTPPRRKFTLFPRDIPSAWARKSPPWPVNYSFYEKSCICTGRALPACRLRPQAFHYGQGFPRHGGRRLPEPDRPGGYERFRRPAGRSCRGPETQPGRGRGPEIPLRLHAAGRYHRLHPGLLPGECEGGFCHPFPVECAGA